MASYLFAYHGGGMPETEEEGARIMKAWTDWFASLGPAVTDPGNPVAQAKSVDGSGSVSDGGGSNPVTGYSVIQADSMDAAMEMAKRCPQLDSGGSVEVCETFQIGP